jgi:FtsP/CotA-like multicopper oxidase with cupredoxin domain
MRKSLFQEIAKSQTVLQLRLGEMRRGMVEWKVNHHVSVALNSAGAVVLLVALSLGGCSRKTRPPDSSLSDSSAGKTNTYYVAADEVDWNYAPAGMDKMMGTPFMGFSKLMTEKGPHRIGTVYRKALYREYTDATFTTLKPKAREWEHTGALGPVLRGEVGDTIRVVFKNAGTHPYSMHPHGVFYAKDSEGADYADGTSGPDKEDGGVPPGKTHVYTWKIPERAGPGPSDPSSVVWLYHSHVNEPRDVNAGLIGAILVSRAGAAGPTGRPKDVDREFISLFMIYDENQSWFLEDNIQRFTTDPKGVKRLEFQPTDENGLINGFGSGFVAATTKATINGYMYANGPMMTMKKGEHVRWYLFTVGAGANFHTPHWHGNVVTKGGHRTDVVPLLMAQMETVDMVPDDPGIWMFHCHVDEHMQAGMTAMYEVKP